MEYKKILSFTVLNSLSLLVFAGFVASCQKRIFPKTGHFTTVKLPARTIASAQNNNDQFIKKFLSYQDPKQIIIFCKLNSKKPEVCYNVHFENTLSAFIKSSKENRNTNKQYIKQAMNYKIEEAKLNELSGNALVLNAPQISKITDKRKQFCAKNSTKNLNKCLQQYIKRDTFSVLNKYQTNFKLNGLEYLYMKNLIRSHLQKALSSAKNEINENRLNLI